MAPADLQRLLFQAVAARDAAALEALCRRHELQIVELFPSWRTVPPPLRDRPDEARAFIEAVIAVARVFDEKLDQPSLLRSLMGDPKDNPLIRWQQELEEARKEMDGYRYKRALDRLKGVLVTVRDLRGTGVDAYLPVTYGYLGECYFQSGLVDRAVEPTRQALDISSRIGDAEGVAAYLGNLYEINRYLGRTAQAADAAVQLSEHHDRHGNANEAARYRRQAELVRRGEPLVRVVVALGGRRYELDEPPAAVGGKVEFLLERNRLVLRPSAALTNKGEQEAQHGRFEQAVQRFAEAAQADRHNPQPHYQAALTNLYLQRYAAAVAQYEKTERRAPGWFHCRSGLWLARQLEGGKVSHQAFLAWHALEDGPMPPAQKVELAARTLKEADIAPLRLLHGRYLLRLGRRGEAAAALRRGLELADEPDVRTRLLVELSAVAADEAERRKLLEEAAALKGNLVASAMATLMLRFGSA